MTYTLTADIGDMSRAEAAALVRAIIERHGLDLVSKAIRQHQEAYIETTKATEAEMIAAQKEFTPIDPQRHILKIAQKAVET